MEEKKGKKSVFNERMEIEGVGVSNFISKDIKEYLDKNFGDAVFPFLGIYLLKKGDFIYLDHEKFDTLPDKKITISYEKKSTKEDLDKFIDFLKKRGK